MLANVPLFGQKYPMILASKGRAVADDDAIAAPTGHAAALRSGLNPDDGAPLRHWGFTMLPAQTYTEDGFYALVNRVGALWLAADVRTPGYNRSFPHVRVVRGVREFQSPSMLAINDPWPVGLGAPYDESYAELVRKNELLGSEEMRYASPIYMAYLP
jgi:hypothetical protein